MADREPLLTRTNLLIGAGVALVGGLVTWMMVAPTRGFAGLGARRRRRGGGLGDAERPFAAHRMRAAALVDRIDDAAQCVYAATGGEERKACLVDAQLARRELLNELQQMAVHYNTMQPEGRERVALPLAPTPRLEPGKQYGHEKRMSPARAARLGIRQELKGLPRRKRRSRR